MQARLIAILKQKGTGHTMSKALGPLEQDDLTRFFPDSSLNIVTKATLLTAILALPKTSEEEAWLQASFNTGIFPSELNFLTQATDGKPAFYTWIQRMTRGNALTAQEAYDGMAAVFNPHIPDVAKAAFLEALRLKRETDAEHDGIYRFLWEKASRISVDVPAVVDLSAAYDGFNRTPFLLPFVACLLASVGVPCVLHGIDEISPKRGMNTAKLLQTAGKPTLLTLDAAKAAIESRSIGWAYVDQSLSFPDLFALKALRQAMVKRPVLSTLEKLLMPVQAKQTYLVTSYTHPPYRRVMSQLMQARPWAQGLLVRGIEGGIQLALDRQTPHILVSPSDVIEGYVKPEDFAIPPQELEFEAALDAQVVLDLGLDALRGQAGYAFDAILYQAAVVAKAFGFESAGVDQLRQSLSSGQALRHWEAYGS